MRVAFSLHSGGFNALLHSTLHTTCREVMRLCVERIAEPCALKIDGVFAGASITWLWKTGLGGGEGRKMVVQRVCMTARADARVSACVYPVIEINRARSLRHTIPRSHWHRESLWSSIGCPCDFRLVVDLRIAPRERRFATHSDSQRKAQGTRRLHRLSEHVFWMRSIELINQFLWNWKKSKLLINWSNDFAT